LAAVIMTNETTKLSPHTTWLFAFGSIAAGIAVSYAASGLGQKVTAALYFAIVAIGGFASTYLTRARIRGALLAFTTGAAVAAAAYYLLVASITSNATTAMGDLASNGSGHAQAVEAGNQMGHIFGVFVAVIVFLESFVAGVVGAVAGAKSRGKGGLAALGAMAKSAR
jgi:hypothetical protein